MLRLKNPIIYVQISATFILQNVAWESSVRFLHDVLKCKLCHFLWNIPFWSNEKHWLMTTLLLTLFIINISQATAMFLSLLNRFQMFSSCFRLTGEQNKYVPVFLGITLIDSFTNDHPWQKIVQKQTEINFYSLFPFKVEYFTCMFTLNLQHMH